MDLATMYVVWTYLRQLRLMKAAYMAKVLIEYQGQWSLVLFWLADRLMATEFLYVICYMLIDSDVLNGSCLSEVLVWVRAKNLSTHGKFLYVCVYVMCGYAIYGYQA